MENNSLTQKVETWFEHDIRIKYDNNQAWFVLKDICDALDLVNPTKVSQRINPECLEKMDVCDLTSSEGRSGVRNVQEMLVVNEAGLYQALFQSRKLEARKFLQWATTVLCKLRKDIGLQPYEAFKLTDEKYQDEIDFLLDSLYYDEKTGKVMQSYTVPGGDVEQREYK